MKDQEREFSALIKALAGQERGGKEKKRKEERRRKEEERKARKSSFCWNSSSVQDFPGFEG